MRKSGPSVSAAQGWREECRDDGELYCRVDDDVDTDNKGDAADADALVAGWWGAAWKAADIFYAERAQTVSWGWFPRASAASRAGLTFCAWLNCPE